MRLILVLTFPFLFGRAFIEACDVFGVHDDRIKFPFLFGRAFIEATWRPLRHGFAPAFPFLFGRAFIEAPALRECNYARPWHFPSFSEGLSLRHLHHEHEDKIQRHFPSFSEGLSLRLKLGDTAMLSARGFPFLFGRAFIEAPGIAQRCQREGPYFPSFSEGLSLRPPRKSQLFASALISLPFRKGFH